MAKSRRHYVKQQGPEKYLSDQEKRILIYIGAVLIAAVIAIFLITALTDATIAMKDGALVGTEDNWIIANAGKGGVYKYYKYGEYDFTSYDGEAVPEKLSYDANSTAVRLYPADGSYTEGYVYATSKPAEEIAGTVSRQMAYMLNDGEVSDVEKFGDGYIYWYTTVEEDAQEDGSVINTYVQVFSCYLPAKPDGSVIVRATYRFDSADAYVDYETGCAALSDIDRSCVFYE